jgi:hypothetical protein
MLGLLDTPAKTEAVQNQLEDQLDDIAKDQDDDRHIIHMVEILHNY